jgi:peptide/nickel transport system substrate-binding protein
MLSSTFFKKRKRIVLISLFLTLAGSFLLERLISLEFGSKPLKIGVVGFYETTNLPLEVSELISYGLTKALPNGQIEPGIAENWQTKDNGKLYTFNLKNNIYWHDKQKVTANNISYNFSDVSIEIVDDKTINFRLKDPFSPLPVFLSQPIFKDTKLTGVGDYKITKITKAGKTIKELKLSSVNKTSPQKIIIKFYPNERAIVEAYKLGEINEIKAINNTYDLEKWPNTKIESKINYNHYVAIFFNTTKDEFADKPVRQALAYAIEKNWDNRALSSYNPSSWAFNNSVKPYSYDLENAKKLIGQNNDESEKSIEKITLSTVPFLTETAEKIKEDWEKFGIKTEIKFINTTSEDYDALLISQEIPTDPDQYVLWHSTQPLNLSHYKSPKLDKLLEDGRKTFDQEKRKEIYLDFQKSLVEESPAIFLYYPTSYNISRK